MRQARVWINDVLEDEDPDEDGSPTVTAARLMSALGSIESLAEALDEMEVKVREAQRVAVREWERNKEFRRQREDARYAAAVADDQETLSGR